MWAGCVHLATAQGSKTTIDRCGTKLFSHLRLGRSNNKWAMNCVCLFECGMCEGERGREEKREREREQAFVLMRVYGCVWHIYVPMNNPFVYMMKCPVGAKCLPFLQRPGHRASEIYCKADCSRHTVLH